MRKSLPKGLLKGLEEVDIVLVDEGILSQAEQWLTACEYCAVNVQITFDYLLDALTDNNPMSEYVMCRPGRCPACSGMITEKTHVSV